MHMRLYNVQKKIWHRKPVQKFVLNIDVSTLGRRVGIPQVFIIENRKAKKMFVKRYGRPGFQFVFDILISKNCNRTRVI